MDPNDRNVNNQQPPIPNQPPAPPQPESEAPDWQQQAIAGANAQPGQSSQQPAQPQPPQQTFPPANGQPAAPSPVVSPMTTPDSNGVPPQMGMHTPSPKNKKRLAIIAVVILLVVAFGVYLLFFRDSSTPSSGEAVEQSQQSAQGEEAIEVSTLQNAVFTAPSDMSEFQFSGLRSTDTFSTYSMTDGDITCELAFGTVSPDELPGETPTAIVDGQLAGLRANGISVDEITAGEALILNDAADSSVTYAIPTLVSNYSAGEAKGLVRYSIAFMQNGRRAIVFYLCGNKSGAVPGSLQETMQSKMEEVTVTPE